MKIKILSIFITLFTISFSLITCTKLDQFSDNNEALHEVYTANPIALEYGLAIDSFRIVSGIVLKNQLLSGILMKHGISLKTIDDLSKRTDVFDMRKMRSGNAYKLFFNNDSLSKLEYFIYEHSLTEYIKIQFNDSLSISKNIRPTTRIKQIASGTIKTNLWDAMLENNIDPMMSIELSEIYAWSIDFFDLKKGDQFFVIYEEKFLDDSTSTGIERIHAALFNHQNKDFYAIYFIEHQGDEYFDENGENLRRQFLKAPLKYKRISSHYTKRRFHPVLKIYRPHSGIDYAAPLGTPVYSVGDGYILKKGFHKNGAGNFIKIKHDKTYSTQYAHLKGFARGLRNGDRIKQGQLIGYVGSTGYSTGPHLDYRFFKNGKAIDPLTVNTAPLEPVRIANKEEYNRIKQEYMLLLNQEKESLKSN